jgi:hypothetical protein
MPTPAIPDRGRDRGRKCFDCSSPALPGRTRCAKHKAACQRANAAHYLRKKAAGLCSKCGRPSVAGKTRCLECSVKYNRKAAISSLEHSRTIARLQDAGKSNFCINCSRERVPGHRRCVVCAASLRNSVVQVYKNRVNRGMCRTCGRVEAVCGVNCRECTEKNVMRVKDYYHRVIVPKRAAIKALNLPKP